MGKRIANAQQATIASAASPKKQEDGGSKRRLLKHPRRRCVGCGQDCPQETLIRLVAGMEGQVDVDLLKKLGGRGAYLCCDRRCISTAFKKRKLSRALAMAHVQVDFEALTKKIRNAISLRIEYYVTLLRNAGQIRCEPGKAAAHTESVRAVASKAVLAEGSPVRLLTPTRSWGDRSAVSALPFGLDHEGSEGIFLRGGSVAKALERDLRRLQAL